MKKNNMKRIACLLLCVILCVCFLASCSSSMGEPLMTLEGNEITVNMYRLWLSRLKGNYGGSDDTVWDQVSEEGKTYNEIFTGFVKQNAMTLLCVMHEFDNLGLKLPEEEIKAVDETMKTILSERGEGDKAYLNSQLSQYGVNYDILRQIYIIEAKMNYLKEYLYGEGGTEVISDNVRNEYYQNNYARIKQIFFYTANKPVTDEEGNYVYDEEGYVETRDYTEEELAEQQKKASQVMTSLTAGQDFDLLMASQNEDTAAITYPNGYYLTKASQYVEEVIDATFELKENEFTMVESEYGIHIIKRLPLEEKGYSASANEDFFSDFEENLETEVFTARLSKYEEKIKIDEELLSKYDVKSSAANTAY
ncbi:MAG: peptidylprolyl isomerase [Clostridia bacterium]|nr:peptidylprolyl isomerase [Clostridia bacterium]